MNQRMPSSPEYGLTPVYRGGKHIGWVKRISKKPKWVCSAAEASNGMEADTYYAEHLGRLRSPATAAAEVDPDKATVSQIAARWLAERRQDASDGAISAGHYMACGKAIARLLLSVGPTTLVAELKPDHFSAFGRELKHKYKLGAAAQRRTVRIVVGFLNHADNEDWIAAPVKIGKKFKSIANAASDSPRVTKFLAPADCRKFLAAVCDQWESNRNIRERDLSPIIQFYAMCLLALNGGYGGTDLAELPASAVDLEAGVIDYRRGKTGKDRIVPLWPETIDAIRMAMELRPAGDPLLFRTREGNAWVREMPATDKDGMEFVSTVDNVNQTFTRIAKGAKMKRAGVGFYAFRHTHRTHSDDAGDTTAADFIMGHTTGKSREHYIHFAQTARGKARLRNVVEHVRHAILFMGGTE